MPKNHTRRWLDRYFESKTQGLVTSATIGKLCLGTAWEPFDPGFNNQIHNLVHVKRELYHNANLMPIEFCY